MILIASDLWAACQMHTRLLTRILVLSAVGILGACMIGDGFVFFRGKVISEQGEPVTGCELALFLASEQLDFTIAKQHVMVVSVEPIFLDGFSIGGGEESYYFSVRCPGYEEPYRSETYVFDGGTYHGGGAGSRLDLGTIVMRK